MNLTSGPNFTTQNYSSSFPHHHQTLYPEIVYWPNNFDLMINVYPIVAKVLTNWFNIIWNAKTLDILISYLILFWINVRFLWDFKQQT